MRTHILTMEREPHGCKVAMSYTCRPEQRWHPRFRLGGYGERRDNWVVLT